MAKTPPKLSDEEMFGPSGLRWLYEIEAVNSPTLQNNLYMNLLSFPGVVDCEILLDRYQRKMLIYVKFTWFLRKFRRAERIDLVNSMLDQLQELLPSFEFRIIEDRKLFEKALRRMERALFGGKDEVVKPDDDQDSKRGVSRPTDVTVHDPSTAQATGQTVDQREDAAQGSEKSGETDSKESSGSDT